MTMILDLTMKIKNLALVGRTMEIINTFENVLNASHATRKEVKKVRANGGTGRRVGLKIQW